MWKRLFLLAMSLLLISSIALSQEASGDKEPSEQPAQTDALMGLGIFAGYWGSWIEGFKDIYGSKGGLTWGAELGFKIRDDLYGVFNYTYFFETHELSELNFTQNVFTGGLRYSLIGAGISWTSVKISSSSTSGIGFYAELVIPFDKHLFGGIKANFVNIDQAKAGGICYYAGYSF